MAIEIVCDVEGCESRTPAAEGMMSVPPGWLLVIRAPDELAVTRARKALMEDDFGMIGGPRGFPPKVFICTKHEFPKLKAPR